MKIPTYCTFLVALAVLPASAQTPAAPPSTSAPRSSASKPSSLSAADKAFVMDAATGGMAEVELGKMAAEKAASADVKQFGQRMADDHGKANGELQALAGQKGVTLPTEPTAAQKATSARLAKLSGAAFDRAYMQDMVKDHAKDVAAFKHASTSAADADLKAWAGKTLPTLEDHQTQAKSVAAKVSAPAK